MRPTQTVFDRSQIGKIMDGQDWGQIAYRTIQISDEYCPSVCFLRCDGQIGFSETMVGIEGLPIAFAYEEDAKCIFNPCFEMLCPEHIEPVKLAFELEFARLTVKGIQT